MGRRRKACLQVARASGTQLSSAFFLCFYKNLPVCMPAAACLYLLAIIHCCLLMRQGAGDIQGNLQWSPRTAAAGAYFFSLFEGLFHPCNSFVKPRPSPQLAGRSWGSCKSLATTSFSFASPTASAAPKPCTLQHRLGGADPAPHSELEQGLVWKGPFLGSSDWILWLEEAQTFPAGKSFI